MKPVRELMQDKRVAAGLAGLALLFVAYRFATSGKRPAVPVPSDNSAAVAAPAAEGGATAGGGVPNGAFSSPAADNAPSAVPRADVAWNWERNPFIGPPKKGSGPLVEEFPKIIVPGFGGNEPGAGSRPPGNAPDPAGTQPPLEEEALPDLRGTVVSGDRGIAIFGSRLVPSGEQVAGWTVERVTAYDVSLRRGAERRTVEMFQARSAEDKGGNP